MKRAWAFNYDFEFELGGESPILLKKQGAFPWYFLNRSSAHLLPLIDEQDLLFCYQKPSSEVLERLKRTTGFLPEFIPLSHRVAESNALLVDLMRHFKENTPQQPLEFKPWGWSPLAFELETLLNPDCKRTQLIESFRKVNSKAFSFTANLSGEERRIPGSLVLDPERNLGDLVSDLEEFFKNHGSFYVKNCFGVSGRGADLIESMVFPPKSLKRWRSWLKKGEGLILEPRIKAKREWSLQYEILENQKIECLGLTRLLSEKGGGYGGSLVGGKDYGFALRLDKRYRDIVKKVAMAGYYGPLGVDLLEGEDGAIRLLEFNARLTFGRLALAWQKKWNENPCGFLFNLFAVTQRPQETGRVIGALDHLERDLGCKIELIHLSQFRGRTMAGFFVSGHDEEQCLSVRNLLQKVLSNESSF